MSETGPTMDASDPWTGAQLRTRATVRLIGWYVIFTACLELINCAGRYYEERRIYVDGNAVLALLMMQWAYDLVRLRARGRKPIVVVTVLQLSLMLAGLGYLIATHPTTPLGSAKILEFRLFTWTHGISDPLLGGILAAVLVVPSVLLVGFLMSRRVRDLLAPSST